MNLRREFSLRKSKYNAICSGLLPHEFGDIFHYFIYSKIGSNFLKIQFKYKLRKYSLRVWEAKAPSHLVQNVLVWGRVPLDKIFVFSVSVPEPRKTRSSKESMTNSLLDPEHFWWSDIFNRSFSYLSLGGRNVICYMGNAESVFNVSIAFISIFTITFAWPLLNIKKMTFFLFHILFSASLLTDTETLITF